MKRLFVLRHAKSSWKHPELSDFERPLNKRGEKAAPFMGSILAEKGLLPEFVMSSPANRAKRTTELVCESAGIESNISFDQRIYEAGSNSLINIVSEFDNGLSSAMIVGHNPGFEGLVQLLVSEYERMPTAALAIIDLDIESWADISSGCGALVEILRPKEQGAPR